MEMAEQYSVAICLDGQTQRRVEDLKQKVFDAFGVMGSNRAGAHITFNTFLADTAQLAVWRGNLQRFCDEAAPFEVSFNHTAFSLNGGAGAGNTLFIAPDSISKLTLTNLMKDFHRKAPAMAKIRKVHNPHITLARGVAENRLPKMVQLFAGKEIGLHFTCDSLCLRKLDRNSRQYTIAETFPFGGHQNTSASTYQTALWV